jgi:hypothetical protein
METWIVQCLFSFGTNYFAFFNNLFYFSYEVIIAS